jgi:GNAT superfamily N-acetyltransferase
VARRTGVRTRPFDLKHFDREVNLVRDIYNSAWDKNWGFVPMTDHEITHMAKQLKPVVIPEIIRFAEIDGKVVAFGLALPNVNLVFKKLGGNLTLPGIVQLLFGAKKLKEVRLLTLGVLEGHRGLGIDQVLYRDSIAAAMRLGITSAEYSWMLEDNPAILRPLERMGAVLYKTYRIYDRPVRATA